MKSLEYYLSSLCTVVEDEAKAHIGSYTIVIKNSQPYKLLDKDQQPQRFWIVQVNDALSLSNEDLQHLRGTFCNMEESYLPIVVMNRAWEVQGVIGKKAAKDLDLTLEEDEAGKTEEFGEGWMTKPGGSPNVHVTTVYWCPNKNHHPDVFPLVLCSSQTLVPRCPECGMPRVKKELSWSSFQTESKTDTNVKAEQNWLSRVVRYLFKSKKGQVANDGTSDRDDVEHSQ